MYLYIDNKNVDVAQTLCSWERSKLKQKEPNQRTNANAERKKKTFRCVQGRTDEHFSLCIGDTTHKETQSYADEFKQYEQARAH